MGTPGMSAFVLPAFESFLNLVEGEELALECEISKQVEEIKSKENGILDVLNECDEANLTDDQLKMLEELKDAAYDAEDILDQHQTEKTRQKCVHLAHVRDAISPLNPMRSKHQREFDKEIKRVTTNITEILGGQDFSQHLFGGRRLHEEKKLAYNHSSISLIPTNVWVRDNERRSIIDMLIPYNNNQANVSILAMHGISEIGKTTLAQLVYNDKSVSDYFDHKLWVQVPSKFDLETVTRSIIELIDQGHLFGAGTNLESLQSYLALKLNGRRYFLVLDDFSHESEFEWQKLMRPLYMGAPGSKILLTTRIEWLAERMSTILPFYRLGTLSEDDCVYLTFKYAAGNNNDAYNYLYQMKSEIFAKCKGMPKNAINLSHRLRHEHDKRKWANIISGNDGEINGSYELMRAIRSSYSWIPSHLKPCLAYCSIIPHTSRIDKEWLIQLWMAQGFIPPKSFVGNDYVNSLVECSLFEKTRADCEGDHHENEHYTIPNDIYEIAQCLSAGECCIFELGNPHDINKRVRHLSVVAMREPNSLNSDELTLKKICQSIDLHTLIIIGGNYLTCNSLKVLEDVGNNLKKLRALDLSDCNLTSLPESIGNLIHLRYLQLQNTKITELPKSIGNLYNLLTLGLQNCKSLRNLSHLTTRYLQRLRHLDLHLDDAYSGISTCCLESMPPNIGLLTDLEILSRFVISKRANCGINELSNLNNLHGELLISNLDLVINPEDAANANLQNKQFIQNLHFIWSARLMPHENNTLVEENVLQNLKPHANIKKLRIMHYAGRELAEWLGCAYLSNLQILCISNCKNCANLPCLGKLPLLMDLSIKGMDKVESLDCSFCGRHKTCFPSLKKLCFESMQNLVAWSGDEKCELKNLEELVVKDCINLQELNHKLPSLTHLKILNSPRLVELQTFPSLKSLEVIASGEWIWAFWSNLPLLVSLTLTELPSENLPSDLQMMNSLQSLEIINCNNLAKIPDDWIPIQLSNLLIKQCPILQELPKGIERLDKLEQLRIVDCRNFKHLPELKSLNSLICLEIFGCHSFMFLPNEGLPQSLRFLSIMDCPLFTRQFDDVHSCDRTKISHVLSAWIDERNISTSSNKHRGESSPR